MKVAMNQQEVINIITNYLCEEKDLNVMNAKLQLVNGNSTAIELIADIEV